LCCREAKEKEKESARGIPRRGLIEEERSRNPAGGPQMKGAGMLFENFE